MASPKEDNWAELASLLFPSSQIAAEGNAASKVKVLIVGTSPSLIDRTTILIDASVLDRVADRLDSNNSLFSGISALANELTEEKRRYEGELQNLRKEVERLKKEIALLKSSGGEGIPSSPSGKVDRSDNVVEYGQFGNDLSIKDGWRAFYDWLSRTAEIGGLPTSIEELRQSDYKSVTVDEGASRTTTFVRNLRNAIKARDLSITAGSYDDGATKKAYAPWRIFGRWTMSSELFVAPYSSLSWTMERLFLLARGTEKEKIVQMLSPLAETQKTIRELVNTVKLIAYKADWKREMGRLSNNWKRGISSDDLTLALTQFVRLNVLACWVSFNDIEADLNLQSSSRNTRILSELVASDPGATLWPWNKELTSFDDGRKFLGEYQTPPGTIRLPYTSGKVEENLFVHRYLHTEAKNETSRMLWQIINDYMGIPAIWRSIELAMKNGETTELFPGEKDPSISSFLVSGAEVGENSSMGEESDSSSER